MEQLQSLAGLLAFPALAWLIGERSRPLRWRVILAGMALQLVLAFVLLKVPFSQQLFVAFNELMLALERATQAGTAFVFGYLGGAPLPFVETTPGASFVLAFRALPIVVVVSALSALLYYWRVLPWLVAQMGRALQRLLGVGGALGMGAAANAFMGMVEAPLLVRPYLLRMDRSELFALMVTGMATIAGTVMVLYASILSPVLPNAMGHILVASLLSLPAALVTAAIMVAPGVQRTDADGLPGRGAASAMDAITRGALDGVQLLINIVALLVVLIALVSLLNLLLGALPLWAGEPVTLQRLLGYLMAPLVWLAGIPAAEVIQAGSLMGIKTVLNEFLAYLDLAQLPQEALSARSELIMVYCLCGFANFGSLGILLGGLGTLVPERRAEVTALGLKSIVAGTLATLMTGAMVGLLTPPA